jgi:hypothetical protein
MDTNLADDDGHVPWWMDSLQCVMKLAMPSCFLRSVSSRQDGIDENWAGAAVCAADADRLFRSRMSTAGATLRSCLEILLREKLARPP